MAEKVAGKTGKERPAMQLRYLLRSRNTLIWIESREERRVEAAVIGASTKEGYATRFWDCAGGVVDVEGRRFALGGEFPETSPMAVFDRVARDPDRCVWVLRDLDPWLEDPIVARSLKSLAHRQKEVVKQDHLATIVVISPTSNLPESLRAEATVFEWPLPSRDDLAAILGEVCAGAGITLNGDTEAILDAAAGLTGEDAGDALGMSIARHRAIIPAEVAAAKKAIIDRERLLTWWEPDPRGLDGVGGQQLLKEWLDQRRLAFTPAARAYGLPPVKGALLLGPSGTGKSLTAKCTATAFGCPLLRLDLGALKGSLVGSSEQAIRKALRTAEAVNRCVLWIDEVEKALAGTRGGGDAGVSADQLGVLLTWMQEQTLPIFVLATSNDPLALAPEFISRFDETWFLDLPTLAERAEIAGKTLELYGRDPAVFNLGAFAAATDGFSGREIAKAVGAAMFMAFADGGRELLTPDLLAVAAETVPVSKSAAETVSALRLWADGRARRASRPEEVGRPGRTFARAITAGPDLDG